MFTSRENYQIQKKDSWSFNIGRLFIVICVNSEDDYASEHIVTFYIKNILLGVKQYRLFQ